VTFAAVAGHRCGRATPSLRDAPQRQSMERIGRDSIYRDRNAVQTMPATSEVEVPKCVFVENGGSLDDYDDDDFTSAFDFGYCLTVHKSQGSEWDKVLLIDENHKVERRRWLYTGLTRAAKSIIVQG
jgi:ATP-dependent exoDNAse (exonuclease V) alpha subunit